VRRLRFHLLAAAVLCSSAPAAAQNAPKLGALTASRLLVLPVQEVTGTAEGRAWLVRFDSAFTVRLEDGGIGPGWAYPRDAVRYARSNPTYVSDPRVMGAQLLKGNGVKAGVPLPEPFASRVRALVAVADARHAVVPIVVRIDSTASPRTATLQLAIVDARLSRVDWIGTIDTPFSGSPSLAADSLAMKAARLFLGN
jgi:hypothetical protein